MFAQLRLFAIATLLPALLIGAAALWGGPWALAAVLSMTALVMGLDLLVRVAATDAAADSEFPAGHRLSILLALLHFALLALVVAALAGQVAGSAGMGPVGRGMLFFAAASWMGQVSNSNAHELIHKGSRGAYRLGAAVYISMLFGHPCSAHRHVHHRHVASARDPATARLGESYYRYAPRAWLGGFRAGATVESDRLRRRDGVLRRHRHPYAAYLGGAALGVVMALWLGGVTGLLWYLGLAAVAQSQLLMSDYVQHYGLTRREVAPGRLEPVGPGHSWNAAHWYSGAMMLNAPRHSDHHMRPARAFPALEVTEEMPKLPYSLPIMAVIALAPPIWRRVMDARVARWTRG